MKFRPHRRLIDEAMAEAVELDGMKGLIERVQKDMEPWLGKDTDRLIKAMSVEPYGGDDDRIGWKDVHIVHIPSWGVVGFTEGMPKPNTGA